MIIREKLISLFYLNNYNDNRKKAEEYRLLFKEYLSENLHDTEIWVKFALLLYLAPLHEDLKAQKCLETVLQYEPNNIQVKLFLAYVIEHYSYINEDLFRMLNTIESPDKALMSIVEYSKSTYYYLTKKDFKGYEQCLNYSIELCGDYVSNYIELGQFYLKRGYIAKGHELMKKGVNNIKYIYDGTRPHDILDIEEFFNERFKRIHLSQDNYEIILESFDPKSPWVTGNFISKREDTLASD